MPRPAASFRRDSLRGRRPTFAEYVGYGNQRLGVNLPVEEGQSGQEAILNRAGNDDETFQLGLHPLERSGGDTTIRSDVEGAGSTDEATAIALSHSRHFEINRRLFPGRTFICVLRNSAAVSYRHSPERANLTRAMNSGSPHSSPVRPARLCAKMLLNSRRTY